MPLGSHFADTRSTQTYLQPYSNKLIEKIMKTEEKKWFLSLPKEMKLRLMSDMLTEGETGMALATMKILLDAPISEGGILSEEISEVFDSNLKKTTS